MGILLAFAPFIAFAVLDRFVGSTAALVAGVAVSGALVLRDVLMPARSVKLLEAGTLLLFTILTIYTLVGGAAWSVIGVRLCVDAGLLAIVVISLLIGRPFTLQYAREQVPAEHWNSPEFLRTNYIISAAWAFAFLVMVLAELALLYLPGMPQRLGVVAIIAALFCAVKFTSWYPDRVKAEARDR